MDYIRKHLTSITCEVVLMITGADVIRISLIAKGVGPTMIWNSGTWRYMHLQTNHTEGIFIYLFPKRRNRANKMENSSNSLRQTTTTTTFIYTKKERLKLRLKHDYLWRYEESWINSDVKLSLGEKKNSQKF